MIEIILKAFFYDEILKIFCMIESSRPLCKQDLLPIVFLQNDFPNNPHCILARSFTNSLHGSPWTLFFSHLSLNFFTRKFFEKKTLTCSFTNSIHILKLLVRSTSLIFFQMTQAKSAFLPNIKLLCVASHMIKTTGSFSKKFHPLLCKRLT